MCILNSLASSSLVVEVDKVETLCTIQSENFITTRQITAAITMLAIPANIFDINPVKIDLIPSTIKLVIRSIDFLT